MRKLASYRRSFPAGSAWAAHPPSSSAAAAASAKNRQTKNQLGDGYGMKQASSIGKEWNEQAAGFCAYVTGKTAAQVAGLAVDESGKAADYRPWRPPCGWRC